MCVSCVVYVCVGGSRWAITETEDVLEELARLVDLAVCLPEERKVEEGLWSALEELTGGPLPHAGGLLGAQRLLHESRIPPPVDNVVTLHTRHTPHATKSANQFLQECVSLRTH